ncbi:hypothetical protein NBG84_37020, partial [Streptomyces sp. CWNU-1]|nr:hypothetical protein [Streptomyces sp. CWNU-1]
HATHPTTAFALSRLANPDTLHPSPTSGVEAPTPTSGVEAPTPTSGVEAPTPTRFGVEAPTPIGVFRSVQRPIYDTLMNNQLDTAVEQQGKGDLAALLTGKDSWTVRPPSPRSSPSLLV